MNSRNSQYIYFELSNQVVIVLHSYYPVNRISVWRKGEKILPFPKQIREPVDRLPSY